MKKEKNEIFEVLENLTSIIKRMNEEKTAHALPMSHSSECKIIYKNIISISKSQRKNEKIELFNEILSIGCGQTL